MRRRSALLAALSLIVLVARPGRGAAPRPLTPEDVTRLREVSEPRISPDGAWVAYTVGTMDLARDKRPRNLWMAALDGSRNVELTFGENSQSHPRWSPDGKWLAFLSGRGAAHDHDQVWLMNRAGGEGEKVTDVKGSVEDLAWSPDSKRLVLAVRDPDPDAPVPGREGEKKTPPPIVIDRFQFKQDIVGYLTNRYTHLFLFDLTTRKAEPLTSGPHDDLLPAWSPDGREIAFVTKRGPDPDRTDDWNIYVIEARAGAKERPLTTSPEADDNPDWESAPAWSPDGKWIAYLHGGDPKLIEYATNTLAVVPAAGGAPRILTPGLDRNLRRPRWSRDGSRIHFLLEEDRHVTLASTGRGGGKVDVAGGAGGTVADFDLGPRGETVVLWGSPERPDEVYALHGSQRLDLSRQNGAFLEGVALARVEETQFRSADGTEVHGFLTYPLDDAKAHRHPALLRPHGGPQEQYTASFNFEAQLFASHGYAVITPNPRGSTGRGTAYARAIYAAWGSVDVQDDLAAVDDAVARGIADPDRLGVGGWSYGGMSTNYIIASTRRFKAATSGASISNVLAGYGTDEYIRDYENELGVPWRNLDAWMRVSYPFYHADRIATPTLFLGGDKDFNVPLLNGEQMYQALRSLRVPAELVIYPGQFHGLTKPSYLVDRLKRYLDWYARWIGAGTSR